MANVITLSILLAVCIFSPVYSAPTGSPALQVVIYHPESWSLVCATLLEVAADGTTGYSHTKFYWHQDGSFESVDFPGKFLLMDAAGALLLGVPNEPTFKHRYTRTVAILLLTGKVLSWLVHVILSAVWTSRMQKSKSHSHEQYHFQYY